MTRHPARPLLQWLLAGDARFTVTSRRTGDYFTVRIARTRRPHEHSWSWFAWGRLGDLGPDPDLDAEDVTDAGAHTPGWFYIGQLMAPREYVQVIPTQATASQGSRALTPLNWVLRQIHAGWDGQPGTVPATLQKSVQCARCRRPLSTPASIARGLGPECFDRQTGGPA